MNLPTVVTGGASGIGLAVAARLLDDGRPVAILDADAEALAEAEERFAEKEVLLLAADVTDEEEIDDAFDQAADALGPVAALVNAAGLAREAPFEATSAELFRQILDVNLVGAFIAARAAVERMGEALSIVNVASVSGIRANRGRAAYGAAHAGAKLMGEVMAVELADRGVRVNCLAPGPLDDRPGGDARAWLERTPQRRYATSEEVAGAAVFLLSPEAAHVNGHTLVVDGGFAIAGLLKDD